MILVCLLVGTGFLGSRGLWDPDEGRYVTVARTMVLLGDYVTPRLGDVPHFTKPPLLYWTIAAGLRWVGPHEWGARLGHGLAFASTAFLVALLGHQLLGPPGRKAGLVYATMILPFAAGTFVTPDTLLTLFETVALLAFWRGWTASTVATARLWMMAFWAGLAFACLTKGPPALLPLVGLLLFSTLSTTPPAAGSRAGWARPEGILTFTIIVLPWYLAVLGRHPGLWSYWLAHEVYGRIDTGAHHRNSGWWMGLWLYPATIALGAFPWSLGWRLPCPPRRGLTELIATVRANQERLFLVAWIVPPALVLSLIPSRLPLYLLPIFPALAIASLGAWRRLGPADTVRLRPVQLVSFTTAGLLLLLRAGLGLYPTGQDARAMARALAPVIDSRPTEIAVLDHSRYGLAFYLPATVETVMLRPARVPEYRQTTDSLDSEVAELIHENVRHVFVATRGQQEALRQQLTQYRLTCEERRGPRASWLTICDAVGPR